MFKTIIWATDGSDLADAALPYVEGLAETHRSRIVAVHARQTFHGGRSHGDPVLADDDELVEHIKGSVEELQARGLTAELSVRSGVDIDAAHMIVAAAKERSADLIVAGTHGRGGPSSAIFGSVARELLHLATCPVLVVPPGTKADAAAESAPAAMQEVSSA